MDFMEDIYPIPWFEDMDMNGSGLHGVLLHDEDPLMPVYDDDEPVCKKKCVRNQSQGSSRSMALVDHNNYCASYKMPTEEDGIHPIVLNFLKGECSVVQGTCNRVPPILGSSLWVEDVDERPKEAESDRGSASSTPTHTSDVASASPRIRGFSSNSLLGSQNQEVSSRKRGRPPAGGNCSNSAVSSTRCPSSNAGSSCVPTPSPRTVWGARGKKCVLNSENAVVLNTGASTSSASTSSGYAGASTSSGYAGASTSSGYAGASTSSGYAGASTSSGYAGASTSSGYAVASTSSGYAGASTSSGYAGASTSSGYAGRKCGSGASSTSSSGRPGLKPGSRGGKSASAPAKKKGGPKSKVPLTAEEQQKKLEKNRQKALKEKERRRRSKELLDQVKAYLLATFPNLLGRRTSHQRLIDTLLQLLPSLHYQLTVVSRHNSLAKKYIKKRQKTIRFRM